MMYGRLEIIDIEGKEIGEKKEDKLICELEEIKEVMIDKWMR